MPAFNVAGRVDRGAGPRKSRRRAWTACALALGQPRSRANPSPRRWLQETGAALIIWGEYDSGRVRVNFTLDEEDNPTWERLLTAQDDLPTVINVDVPQQVQALALLTLGRLYREQGDYEDAIAAFERALRLDLEDEETLAAVHFYLGTVYERLEPPDFASATEAYGKRPSGLTPI